MKLSVPQCPIQQYYAEQPRRKALDYGTLNVRRGIIWKSALCVLCRYRHKTHWTRHETRLNRDFGRKRFGDEGYAMEELVAEIGAAFLCADLGITPETREDHAAYIASWLKVLRQDKRAIFTAASHAQRATEHLHAYQPREI
jgi:antirestriction protein ArdC